MHRGLSIPASFAQVKWSSTLVSSGFSGALLVCAIVLLSCTDLPAADPPALSWRTRVEGDVVSVIPAGSNGVIAVTFKGKVTALAGDGAVRWQLNIDGAPMATPVCDDSALYISTEEGFLQAVSLADGAILWQHTLKGRFQSAPFPAKIDTQPALIIMEQGDGMLIAVSREDGSIIWQSDTTARCDGTPLVTSDRIIYGNCDASVYFFDLSNGKQVAKVPLGSESQIAGGIGREGDTIFAGTRDGDMVALSLKDQEFLWRTELQEEAFVTPVATPERVIGGAYDGLIAAMRVKDGSVLWRKQVDDTPV